MNLKGLFQLQQLSNSVVLWSQKQLLVLVFATCCEMAIWNFLLLLIIMSLTRQLGHVPVQVNCTSVFLAAFEMFFSYCPQGVLISSHFH